MSRPTLSRRSLLLFGAATLPSLAACSSGGDPAAGGSASDAGGDSSAFPVDIAHVYGTTKIPSKPTRIATVSWVNADSLLALNVLPVGMPKVEWGGNKNASTDWIDAKLKELVAEWGTKNAPKTYSEADGPATDAIAALAPDLIVAAYSGLTKEQYETLSKIAPTIGPLAPNYTAGWQDVLVACGKATGLEPKAMKLVKKLEGELADVGTENSEVAKSTFIAGNLDTATNAITLYTAGDTRPRFFAALGMTMAPVVEKNTKDPKTYSLDWTPERADELDADVFYTWAAKDSTVKTFQGNALFNQIPAVKKGSLVLTADDHETLAISAANALSLPWAIEHVVPRVVEAAKTAKSASS